MPVPSFYAREAEAIRTLRAKYPTLPQLTLAKRIRARDFEDNLDRSNAMSTGTREVLSIYSVIRRFDAAKLSSAAKAA